MLPNNYLSHYTGDLGYKLMSATEATLKVISSTTEVILATKEVTRTILKIISATISDLRHIRSDHILLNNDLSHYKGDLGHK